VADKYLFFTDLHLDKVLPWDKVSFIRNIIKENPKGIIITGDISSYRVTPLDLKLLTTFIKCPIYFVDGNHDYYLSSFEEMNKKISKLCDKNPRLIHLDESDFIPLTKDVALIGHMGWGDVSASGPEILRATIDWIFIKELRELTSMKQRLKVFHKLADESCHNIEEKLVKCLDLGYKTIYIATHFPPYKEATNHIGTFFEKYWLSFNVNARLGKTISRIMGAYKGQNVIILCGHSHIPMNIDISDNIECCVGDAGLIPKEILL
jgi:predicted MPP superfamily phosphohydrolase